ncbi:MAG: hypothetical protein C0524_10595 [Rhodobacter sp.]|nr:hypothetical protein [Rhodobacter sp.]
MPIGQSSSLRVGDYVMAIGNPFGPEQTVTLDSASALGRRGLGIEGYENFIRTDAPINPGNSGGALIAQIMQGGAAEAAGLRPRDVIVALDEEAVTNAAARRWLIGLRTPEQKATLDTMRDGMRMSVEAVAGAADQTMRQQRLGSDEAEQPQRLQAMSLTEAQRGLAVAAVAPVSGASRAGLMVGDRVTAVGNTPVNRIDQFHDAVVAAPPDDPVLIEVERQGTAFFIALPQPPIVP